MKGVTHGDNETSAATSQNSRTYRGAESVQHSSRGLRGPAHTRARGVRPTETQRRRGRGKGMGLEGDVPVHDGDGVPAWETKTCCGSMVVTAGHRCAWTDCQEPNA